MKRCRKGRIASICFLVGMLLSYPCSACFRFMRLSGPAAYSWTHCSKACCMVVPFSVAAILKAALDIFIEPKRDGLLTLAVWLPVPRSRAHAVVLHSLEFLHGSLTLIPIEP